MSDKSDITNMVKDAGFKFIKANKHELWVHPSGVQLRLPIGSKLGIRYMNELKTKLKHLNKEKP
jgi:hypothetical protein